MKIGHLDTSERVVIVAEIGLNHEGDIGVAHELVERAAAADADAVKFQIYRTEKYADPSDAERYSRLSRLELWTGWFDVLAHVAHDLDLAFIATPFDLESADLCVEICDAVKIASKDIDLWPLLERVADSSRPMIVSTGLCDMERVRRTVEWINARRDEDLGLAVLHCVSAYPTPGDQAELRAISLLACMACCEVGYSDHTIGIDAAPLAVALGARIIEKHFTLAHDYSDFRDHQLSATPDEMTELVRRIRQAESMLGEPVKRVQPCELDNMLAFDKEREFRISRLT